MKKMKKYWFPLADVVLIVFSLIAMLWIDKADLGSGWGALAAVGAFALYGYYVLGCAGCLLLYLLWKLIKWILGKRGGVFSERSNKREERILFAASIVLAVAFVFVTLWNVNLLHRF